MCLARSSNCSASYRRSPRAKSVAMASSSAAPLLAAGATPDFPDAVGTAKFRRLARQLRHDQLRHPLADLGELAKETGVLGFNRLRDFAGRQDQKPRAFFGPIPLTVMKRLKKARSSLRRKPTSRGSMFPPDESPSRIEDRVEGHLLPHRRVKLGEVSGGNQKLDQHRPDARWARSSSTSISSPVTAEII